MCQYLNEYGLIVFSTYTHVTHKNFSFLYLENVIHADGDGDDLLGRQDTRHLELDSAGRHHKFVLG